MAGMKSSTIKKLLNKKIGNFIKSIDDEKLAEEMSDNLIVTGGCITSMLLGEKINDYDIYFSNFETTKKVAEYYVKKFNDTKGELKASTLHSCNPEVQVTTKTNIRGEEEKRIIIYMKSSGVASETQTANYEYFENRPEGVMDEFVDNLTSDVENLHQDIKKADKYRPIFLTDNAISLSNDVQLIIRFYGNPSEIHKNFDFVHTHNYYVYCNNDLVLSPEALQATLSKSLIYKGSLYPLTSIFRIKKFLSRGWRITAGQELKILWQISEVNLDDMETLRDQLIGVDSAYMFELLSALKNTDKKIDSTYLMTIIDEIFE